MAPAGEGAGARRAQARRGRAPLGLRGPCGTRDFSREEAGRRGCRAGPGRGRRRGGLGGVRGARGGGGARRGEGRAGRGAALGSRRAGRVSAPSARPAAPARSGPKRPRRPLCDPARLAPSLSRGARGAQGAAAGRRRVPARGRFSSSAARESGRRISHCSERRKRRSAHRCCCPGTAGRTRPARTPPPGAPRMAPGTPAPGPPAARVPLSAGLGFPVPLTADQAPRSGRTQGLVAECHSNAPLLRSARAKGSRVSVLTVGLISSSWAPGHQDITDRPLAGAEVPSGMEHNKPQCVSDYCIIYFIIPRQETHSADPGVNENATCPQSGPSAS